MELFALVFILTTPTGGQLEFALDTELSYAACIHEGQKMETVNEGLVWECVQIDFN